MRQIQFTINNEAAKTYVHMGCGEGGLVQKGFVMEFKEKFTLLNLHTRGKYTKNRLANSLGTSSSVFLSNTFWPNKTIKSPQILLLQIDDKTMTICTLPPRTKDQQLADHRVLCQDIYVLFHRETTENTKKFSKVEIEQVTEKKRFMFVSFCVSISTGL